MKKQLLYFILLNVAGIFFWWLIWEALPDQLPMHSDGVRVNAYEPKMHTFITITISFAGFSLLMFITSIWLLKSKKIGDIITRQQVIRVLNIVQVISAVVSVLNVPMMTNQAPYKYLAFAFPLVLLYEAIFNPILKVPVTGMSAKVVGYQIVKYRLTQTERKAYVVIVIFLMVYNFFSTDLTWFLLQSIVLMVLLMKMTLSLLNEVEKTK
ncbi:hypothetical protein [Brochothrix thermosphacta]|uniref:hypothetical protein n=1 Tax=Brochothrix thermosphacta TaxID=2756 RepID=UPI0039B079DB